MSRPADAYRPFQFSLRHVAGVIVFAALMFSHPHFREHWGFLVAMIVFLVVGWLLEETEKKYRSLSDDSWYLGHVLWRIQRMFLGVIGGLYYGFFAGLFFAILGGFGGFEIVVGLCAVVGGAWGLLDSYAKSPAGRLPPEQPENSTTPARAERPTTPDISRRAPPRLVRRCSVDNQQA